MSQLSFHAHRSGHEALQYCPRRRYLAYHHLGTGINVFPPIYFDIGTAVHAGLASLLTIGITQSVEPGDMQDCINVALQYFYDCPVYQTLPEYDRNEQVTLISGLLWAFYYRAWPSFAEKYEVLMVEKPSTETRRFPTNNDPWQNPPVGDGTHPTDASLTLHSRPDAIVMDRHTGEVVAINWKTINTLTDERRYNITSSLQVNLEHYYAERLYSRWMDEEFVPDIPEGVRGRALMEYLDQQQEYYKSLPREVAYSQIVYLVKGDRSLMLADGAEVPNDAGDEYSDAEKVWRQNSFLCYRYLNLANGSSSWTGRHYKAGNKSYSLLTPKKDWVKQPVWEGEEWNTGDDPPTGSSAVEWWVQLLNSGKAFPSTHSIDDPRNEVQPLNRVVVFEEPIYRDVERMERFVEQVFAREVETAQRLIRVTQDRLPKSGLPEVDAEFVEPLDDILDREFPQQLISCRKPTRCEFDGKICNQPPEGRTPLFTILPEGGIWQKRVPHHVGEREALRPVDSHHG